jgi:hypothetical protein
MSGLRAAGKNKSFFLRVSFLDLCWTTNDDDDAEFVDLDHEKKQRSYASKRTMIHSMRAQNITLSI